jgi:hypothetical protein
MLRLSDLQREIEVAEGAALAPQIETEWDCPDQSGNRVANKLVQSDLRSSWHDDHSRAIFTASRNAGNAWNSHQSVLRLGSASTMPRCRSE